MKRILSVLIDFVGTLWEMLPKKGKYILVVLLSLYVLAEVSPHMIRRDYVFKVTNIESKTVKGNSKGYIIGGVTDNMKPMSFVNIDSFWEWKFNSGDFRDLIMKDKRYKVRAYGIRFKLFSLRPNIVSLYIPLDNESWKKVL